MWGRLSELARGSSGSEELVLRENYGRDGAARIAQLAAQAGLQFRSYGSGRATVLVASTQPLPSYRADLVVAGGGRRSVVPVDEREVRARFDALARSGGELVLRENFGREGAAFVGELAARAGLHFRSYGKGINTVLVASTEPLPNYRADLDARHGTKQAEVSISGADAHRLEAALERVQRSSVLGDVGAGRAGSSGAHAGDTPVGEPGSGAATEAGGARGYVPPHMRERKPRGADASNGVVADVPDNWDSDGGAAATVATPGADAGAPPKPTATGASREASQQLQERQRAALQSPAARRMLDFRRKLPAFDAKARLLEAVASHQVVVVSGETGCGKTTQLPQVSF